MDRAVIDYKRRRAERIASKKPVRMDAVDKFRARRMERLESRMDAGVGWVFGALKSKGIDTSGMDLDEAFEKWNEINKGKGGNGKKEEPEAGKNAKGEEESKKAAKGSSNHKSKARNHEFDGSGYNGDPGEVKTGKSGNLRPKNEAAKKINCADAVGETDLYKKTGGDKGRASNSLTGHIDENGNLTPERQKVHDEIVQNFFKNIVPQKGRATMTMSGGGPASGKSFIEKAVRKRFGDETTVTVDPDKIKEMLPGYTDMAIATDDAAGHYHEESSALAKRIYQYAVDNNVNVVYDGTGDGSVNSVKKKIKTARDAGYEVNGEYVTVDVDSPNGAVFRNQKRYENGMEKFKNGKSDVPPRKPKESHLRQIHSDVSDILPQVFDLFDNFKLFDNNGEEGSEPTLVGTSKIGGSLKLEKGQEANMEKFLRKGKAGWKFADGKFSK